MNQILDLLRGELLKDGLPGLNNGYMLASEASVRRSKHFKRHTLHTAAYLNPNWPL